MRLLKITFLVLIGMLAFHGQSQPLALFNEANTAYQQERFEEAIVLYDSIVDQGYEHAETFYNLANAHFRAGHLGLAILNYERALQLNPKDEDAAHNLNLAQKQVVDEFNVVPTPALTRIFKDYSSIFSSSVWSIVGLSFLVFMVVLLGAFLFKSRNTFLLTLAGIFFMLALIFEGTAYGKYNIEQQKWAILTDLNGYVKSAPAERSQDLFILHEGTKVQVLDAFEGYSKIKLPDGKIGWIASHTISVM